MGVDLGELVEPEEISFADLNDKVIAVDAMNTMYQFLSIIRQRDGTPLKDSDGNTTSHLSGLFYRSINLLEKNIRPVYVFDGKPPQLKAKEAKERRKKREEAREEWEKLKEEGKISEAYSKATQSSKLTGDMIEEAQKLLDAMGLPYIVAESEGEAQAAYMVQKGSVYAVGSQDWDCLLFGADVMVRNLTSRKTRKTSGGGRKEVSTEKIDLESVLDQLDISHEKLQWLGILVGTDFNPDGIYGIGPKTALELVKQYDSFDDLMEDDKVEWESDNDPDKILDFFQNPPVEDTDFEFESPDKEEIRNVLIEQHDFSEKRVNSGLEKLDTALESRQSGLDSFT
ncbi:flap endonuclease-1 [Candidatus Nanohalobium constans]|uniref:Flap endonuclease 1 n=1 Tax=Candidatus Nanohalobium constans TaxID=2565781 RepID=A0A5Q0UJ33_9ARCH|nr:flap endonuclease-1 [Candidatus Nanohalobium constans]QGA80839.1 flap endonuclease-1 [Candidatus Nanohalobium constans]